MLDLLRDYGLNDFYLELSTRDDVKDKFVGSRRGLGGGHRDAARRPPRTPGLELVADPGGAAFYGPKISVQARDAIGRTWQMSTIQVDFNLPERFGLEYQAADGSRQQPIMIHRALFGSIERFFGILVEHYAGAFPPWLAPVQVVGIPIADAHVPYLERGRRPGCASRASGSRSTPATTGCRRRSATRSGRRCRSCCSPGTTTWPRARCRSATATGRRSNGVPVAEADRGDRRRRARPRPGVSPWRPAAVAA